MSNRTNNPEILVVDDDGVFRGAVELQLEQHSLVCRTATSYQEAQLVLQRAPAIDIVLLDHPPAATSMGDVVKSLRAARPGLTIVGNSGADRRQEFARAGVKRFLDKPWRVDELITILKGRMRSCGECGLPLPLRRPLEGEVGGQWVCAFCGSRYLGLLDEDAPEQLISNARRAECT